jgi:hypothetical protein
MKNGEISQRLLDARLYEVNEICDSSTKALYVKFMETLNRLSVAGIENKRNLILEAESIFSESINIAVEVSYNIGQTDIIKSAQ